VTRWGDRRTRNSADWRDGRVYHASLSS
jgi:hypothetical protein